MKQENLSFPLKPSQKSQQFLKKQLNIKSTKHFTIEAAQEAESLVNRHHLMTLSSRIPLFTRAPAQPFAAPAESQRGRQFPLGHFASQASHPTRPSSKQSCHPEWNSVITEDDMYTVPLPQIYLRHKDCVSLKLGGLFLEIHQMNTEYCCFPPTNTFRNNYEATNVRFWGRGVWYG